MLNAIRCGKIVYQTNFDKLVFEIEFLGVEERGEQLSNKCFAY